MAIALQIQISAKNQQGHYYSPLFVCFMTCYTLSQIKSKIEMTEQKNVKTKHLNFNS
jgi:hypothetical protein